MRNLIARLDVCAAAFHFNFLRSATLVSAAIMAFAVLPIVPPTFASDVECEREKWIKSAQDSGRLKVDFYSPDQQPNAFPGWTDFDLTLEYKYDQKTRWTPTKGNKVTVTIVPTFSVIKPLVSHTIKLPVSIDTALWHESILGRHELDHVAIGSHPRLILLTTHLVKSIGTVKRTVERVADVTQKWAQESIASEVNDRRRAVQLLVTSNNERLDELTRHGGRDIAGRDAFFDRLFLKENLDESKFEYLGDVIKLLETEDYRRANVHFMK